MLLKFFCLILICCNIASAAEITIMIKDDYVNRIVNVFERRISKNIEETNQAYIERIIINYIKNEIYSIEVSDAKAIAENSIDIIPSLEN